MAITLANDIITVTLDAGAKGSSSSKAWTIDEVYQASVANGWNIIRSGDSTYGVYSYTIPYRLNITANTYFKAENCNLIFSYYNSSRPGVFTNSSTSYVTLTKCSILYKPSAPISGDIGLLGVYNAIVTDCYISAFYSCRFYSGSVVTRTYINSWVHYYANTTFNNCIFLATAGSEMYGPATIERSIIHGYFRTTSIPNNSDVTLRNLTFTHPSLFFQVQQQVAGYGDNFNVNLVDCYYLVRTFNYAPGSTVGKTGVVNLKSTFRFFGNQGATLKVYDKNSNLVKEAVMDLTSYSTEITYFKAQSVTPDITYSDYAPFRVVVEKTGYQAQVFENIAITPGQPIDIRFNLNVESLKIISLNIFNPGPSSTDGIITVIADKGTQPYTYSLNGTDYQESNVFSSLSEGVYSVYVKDSNGLVASLSGITLKSDEVITPRITVLEITQPTAEGDNGIIKVSAHDGVGPYLFAIDENGFQPDGVFTGISKGNHVLYVKDSLGMIGSLEGVNLKETIYYDRKIELSGMRKQVHFCNLSIKKIEFKPHKQAISLKFQRDNQKTIKLSAQTTKRIVLKKQQ